MKSRGRKVAEGKQRSRKSLFQSAFLGCVVTAVLWAAAAGTASASTKFRVSNDSDIPMALLSSEQLFARMTIEPKGGYWETTLSSDIKSGSLVFVTRNNHQCTITLPAQTVGYLMVSSTISNASGTTLKVDVTTTVFTDWIGPNGARSAVPGPSMNCTAK